MPYAPSYTEEEEQLPGATGGGGMAGGVGAPAPTAAPAPAPGGASLPGSRFVNFDKMMSANQSVSDRIAKETETKAKSAYDTAREGIGNVSGTFQAGVKSGSLGPYKEVETYKAAPVAASTPKPVGKTANGVSVVTAKQPGLMAAPAAPNAVSIADARKFSERKYTGPASMASVAGYNEALAAARTADDYTGNVGTNEGRGAILGRDYGVGRGAGRTMDAALLGAAGGRQLKDLGRFAGFAKQIESANADSILEAQKAGADTDAAAAGYRGAVDRYDAAARQDAANRQVAAEQALARQQQQANMAHNAGRGDLQNTTVSINDERMADMHGLGNEWRAAGSPPWDAWYAARKKGK